MIQNTATWCDRGPCGHRLLVYQHVEWLELIDKQKNDSHRQILAVELLEEAIKGFELQISAEKPGTLPIEYGEI